MQGVHVEKDDADEHEGGAGHNNAYEMLPSCVELVHAIFEECLEILE